MSSYKLYHGGYGIHMFYTVAQSEDKAVENIQTNHNMKHLPVTAKVIDEVDGYIIKPVKAGEKNGNSNDS